MRIHSAVVLLGFLMACTPYSVHVDYDRAASYGSYKTFDWYEASKRAKAQARGSDNPIMDRRVRAAVERELAAKGYRMETQGETDFLVTYYPIYRERRTHVRTTVGVGFGGWYRPWGYGVGTRFSTGETHHYKEGTIALEIVDAKSNQLVWQGVAEGALSGLDNPEEAEAQIGRAVKDMLDRFPPR